MCTRDFLGEANKMGPKREADLRNDVVKEDLFTAKRSAEP